ncbi:MAG: hypothetical protein GX567_16870 [Clostridia bacterium]|nr:hypothetical protein [Clostridia bacterium]
MGNKVFKGNQKILAVLMTAGVITVSATAALGLVVFEHSPWNKMHQMNAVAVEQIHNEQYEEAAETYRAMLELDDNNQTALKGLSDAYLGMARSSKAGDFNETVENYRKAIACDHANLSAYRELADLYFQNQRLEAAFMTLDELNSQYKEMLSHKYLITSIASAK